MKSRMIDDRCQGAGLKKKNEFALPPDFVMPVFSKRPLVLRLQPLISEARLFLHPAV
jgi:hypothetical protein